MVAVRRPLHMSHHEHSARAKILVSIAFIFLAAAVINVYQYFWFQLKYNACVNGTSTQYPSVQYDYEYMQPESAAANQSAMYEAAFADSCDSYHMDAGVNKSEAPLTAAYVEASVLVFAVLVIVLPLVLLIGLSSALLYYLRQSGRFIRNERNGGRGEHYQRVRIRERKVLVMIIVTITTFVILNFPSGVAMCLQIYYQSKRMAITQGMIFLSEVSNILVTMNKSCNFIVYCTSSFYFRKNVFALVGCTRLRCVRKRVSRRYLQNSSWFATTENIRVKPFTPHCHSALSNGVAISGSLRDPGARPHLKVRIKLSDDLVTGAENV